MVFDDGQGLAQSRNQWAGDGRYGARQQRQKNGLNDSHHHLNSHDSNGYRNEGSNGNYIDKREGDDSAYTGTSDPSRFLARLLSFLETPPHLRRVLFPLHPDLRNAGTLPSLAMPHHLKADEWCPYREGVVLSGSGDGDGVTAGLNTARSPHDGNEQEYQEDVKIGIDSAKGREQKKRRKEKTSKEAKKNKPNALEETSTSTPHLVNVGYPNPITVHLPASVPPSTRLTLHLADPPPDFNPSQAHTSTNITAVPVPPTEPRNTGGYYWGYTVRQASSLSAIFTECPYAGGYDVSFGTSERGIPLGSLASSITFNPGSDPSSKNDSAADAAAAVAAAAAATTTSTVPAADVSPLTSPFQHVLLVFGGVAGLEKALEADEILSGGSGSGTGDGAHDKGKSDQKPASPAINDVSQLFDFWVNLVPGQGSRTIRTEEAVWLGLMGFGNLMDRTVEGRRG